MKNAIAKPMKMDMLNTALLEIPLLLLSDPGVDPGLAADPGPAVKLIYK